MPPAKPGLFARIAAAARLVAGRGVAQNYNSTAFSRARGRVPHNAPADARQELSSRDRIEIMRLTRYLRKNSPFVAAAVEAYKTYVVGNGFRYVPQSADPEFNRQARKVVADILARPEISGRFDTRDLLRMTVEAQKVDGEIAFIKTRHPDGSPCVQAIEAHRITQPDNAGDGWFDGIKYDRQGRPVAYAVKNDSGSFQYFRAESIIHYYNPERFSGGRGVSPFQVAVTTLRDRSEILESEKLAVKSFSQKAFVLKSASGEFDEEDAGILGRRPQTKSAATSGDCTSAEEVSDAFGGQSIAIGPNEDIKAFDFPNRPSAAWLGFDTALQRDSSLGLGLPLDFLVDPTKINGTVARMVIKQAEKAFEADKILLDHKFLRVFIRYALAVRIEQGLLPAAEGWERMAFQYPRPISVDLGRDAGTAIRELESGIRNLRDIIEENQDEYEAQVIERLDDFAWAKAEAEKRGLPFDLVFKFTNQAPTPIATPAARAAAGQAIPLEPYEDEGEAHEMDEAQEDADDTAAPTSEDGSPADADGNQPEGGPQISNPIA